MPCQDTWTAKVKGCCWSQGQTKIPCGWVEAGNYLFSKAELTIQSWQFWPGQNQMFLFSVKRNRTSGVKCNAKGPRSKSICCLVKTSIFSICLYIWAMMWKSVSAVDCGKKQGYCVLTKKTAASLGFSPNCRHIIGELGVEMTCWKAVY